MSVKLSALLSGLLLLGFTGLVSAAGEMDSASAAQWLLHTALAAREQSYSGTFVYRDGEHRQTCRITHVRDGNWEQEKLITLDGPPREVIRTPESVFTLFLDTHRVLRGPRGGFGAAAAISEELLGNLALNYRIWRVEAERVAGRETQVLLLQPRDAFRYGHKFWADLNTGLLLRAAMINGHDQVDHFQFIELTLGALGRDAVRPSLELPPAGSTLAPEAVDSGWGLRSLPSGFRKIRETARPSKVEGSPPVVHLTYSDGLAAVSVFIEALRGRNVPQGIGQRGGTNLATRVMQDYLITVVGDVPPPTVVDMSNAVFHRSP